MKFPSITRQTNSPELWQDLRPGKDLYAREEYATLWLWAYPQLLGWPRPFAWLFSPVVGQHPYPGDLWGVDAAGIVLAVETKRGRGCDPFVDFIAFERGAKETASAAALRSRWLARLQDERNFWERHGDALREGNFKEQTAPGITPYSSKRVAVAHWQALYSRVIAPVVFSPAYQQQAEAGLRAREGNREVVYFGLIFAPESRSALLSARGETHRQDLAALAGAERVRLLALSANEDPDNQVIRLCMREI